MFRQKPFLLCSGISVLGSSLTYICLLVMVVKSDSTTGIAWLIVSSQLGITFSGIINGYVCKYLNCLKLLRLSEAFRTVILISILLTGLASLPIICLLMFIMSLIEGVYHPNRYRFINLAFSNNNNKNIFISKLQSVDSSLSVVGPIIGGILVTIFSIKLCLILDLLSFLISFLYWNFESRNPAEHYTQKDEHSIFEGYKIIKQNKSLILMNISRVLGNYIFTLWNLFLPILILQIYSETEFGFYQGLTLGSMAFGLFIANFLISRKKLQNECSLEKTFLILALFSGVLAIILLLLEMNEIHSILLLLLISFVFGISNAGFRTGGILIGTRITPKDKLHLVISAADSLIRPATAIITVLLGAIITMINHNIILMNILVIIGFFALSFSINLYFKSRNA